MGHLHEWVGYSTLKNNACISMDFVLHSLNAGNFDPPVPEFDKAAESAVFTQIMSTFEWVPSTPPTVVPPPVVSSPNIRDLFMIDSSNGWAISEPYVLRTGDGGTTWYNVTMPGVASVKNGFFQNSNTGWVIATLSEGNVPALFRTTDGGSTWVTYNNIPFNGGYIQFLDPTHGFVMPILGAATNKQSVALYQTSDGGTTWIRNYINDPTVPGAGNSLPLSGHKNGMTFRDTTTGWVGGGIPTDGFVYLYKTSDSGVTWSQQPLPLPAGYEHASINTTAPEFFGANDGILPVWMTIGIGMRDLFIYSTHNGGSTWSISSAFVRQGNNADFISINNGFAWDGAGLFHFTNNAGASWSNITPNVNFGDGARDMDFVSTTTGWLLDADSNGNAILYRTTDGAATWTLLFGNPPTSNPTPPPTATPPPSPTEFSQALVGTLNAKNFDAVKALMDQSFRMAFWQSQGTPYTPDLAIEQLRTNYIGTSTVLTTDPGKDLTALLGGVNPYSIVGLDASNSQALFVSGWGLDGKGEAILYVTRRADGSLYWHSVLIAPSGFAPPVTLTGPYAVIRVALNDVLNIRAGAGVSQPIVGSFPPDAINVMRTGPAQMADGSEWMEVQRPDGGTGWVNSFYLTEYVSHDTFCADTRIAAMIEQLKGSMNQLNGDMFAGLASLTHGIDVRLWAYQPAINFNPDRARSAFASMEVYNWGAGPRGEPDFGTFKDVIQPKMLEVLNAPNMETYCDNLTKVYPLSTPWPYTNIRFYNLYKPGTPGTELDFRTWLIGFEYIGNQPYLHSLVTIPWEP